MAVVVVVVVVVVVHVYHGTVYCHVNTRILWYTCTYSSMAVCEDYYRMVHLYYCEWQSIPRGHQSSVVLCPQHEEEDEELTTGSPKDAL